jgi:hypothetical protein
MKDPDDVGAIDLGDVIDALRPHLKAMVETIGIAGSATTDAKGNITPGDIRAANIGLELVSKYLSGKGSSRAGDILKEIQRLRGPETEVSNPTEG